MSTIGVIPTFHIGLRNQIFDADGIVNYVLRHVIMNPGSIYSTHRDYELSMKKIEGDHQDVGEQLFSEFCQRLQSILDRYSTESNRFIVAHETINNPDGKSATMKLSIKGTYNNRLISYDRDFLVNDTKKFRETILNANGVNTAEQEPLTGPIQNTDLTEAPPPTVTNTLER